MNDILKLIERLEIETKSEPVVQHMLETWGGGGGGGKKSSLYIIFHLMTSCDFM